MESTKQRQTIELFLFLACFFVVWSLRATYLYSIDESITSNQLRFVYSSLIKFAIWVVPAFGFAHWIRSSSPLQYLGLSVLPPIRQWVLYLVVIGLFFSVVIGFETFLGGKTFSMTGITLSITISGMLFHFVTPLIEEILFRGLVMKELLCLLPGLKANITTSLLFAGIHFPFWLSHDGLTEAVLATTVSVFIFSLLAGWLYQRSASVWPSTIAHIANNFIAALLVVKNG